MSDSVLFAVCPPGLEDILHAEIVSQGWSQASVVAGGVEFQGGWQDVWRANIVLRGATRILVRLGSFRAFHLAQLDKRARKFEWGHFLRPDVPVKAEVTSRRSKIYHAGAAKQRIERAISETLGAPIGGEDAVVLKVRIEDDLVTISLDSSGESLHKRGHKEAVGKAPIRETLAALFMRACGFDGSENLLDPMCGSGTFPIEAAEWAAGLAPGRARGFAFEQLATYEADNCADLRKSAQSETPLRFFGSDRNAGAVQMAQANAKRAGVQAITSFSQAAISDAIRPDCAPGLIMINPPYGGRIGNKKLLFGLYGAMGQRLKEQFQGWRVGIVTSDTSLARATGLPKLTNGAPIPHGGLKVRLFQSQL
ncbi:class I SAM-dependent RNA methyltransferase [Cognatishimia sp.]|uniref:THUMP domain-containing class I SAM-dependent RNA methyltransferase n=1 Tax=Cognatishimia sp. TaxID=2211648 RepID=UPI003511F54B